VGTSIALALLTVCPGCDIQAVVERAKSGDTIALAAGRYTPQSKRDVPFQDVAVRAYIVIDGKNLTLVGKPGTVIDGSNKPATAIVIRHSEVTLRDLDITGFRYEVEEDNVYDGHGVFVIDGKVRIDNVTIRKCQKMALTGAGTSMLDVSRLQVLDGHVAVWLRDSSYLRLTDSVIRGNDSAAIAAYDNSVAHAASSVFEGNQDDSLYTEDQAVIFATGAKILRNRPIAVHATGRGRIWVGDSTFAGNEKNTGADDEGEVLLGGNVREQ
jgi:Right handed beta helix region